MQADKIILTLPLFNFPMRGPKWTAPTIYAGSNLCYNSVSKWYMQVFWKLGWYICRWKKKLFAWNGCRRIWFQERPLIFQTSIHFVQIFFQRTTESSKVINILLPCPHSSWMILLQRKTKRTSCLTLNCRNVALSFPAGRPRWTCLFLRVINCFDY